MPEIEAIRRVHPRAYDLWTAEEDTALRAMHLEGFQMPALSGKLQWTEGAIRSRLKRMDLRPTT